LGCSQSTSTIEEPEGLNDQQLELKSKLEQTSYILTELVKNPLIVKEIQLATNYSLLNGRDEDVTFSELFYEDAEYKIALKSKNENMIGAFKDSFREYINLKSKTNGNEVDPELEAYLVSNHLKIYFPYSENWTNSESINPTISYHPLINEDINEGFINSTGQQKSMNSIETVMVDDQYAHDNPSFLVVPCEEPPNLKSVVNSATICGGGGGGSGDGGSNPDETEPGDFDINQVFLKSVRLTEHYDGLFAGGSEVFWQLTDAVQLTSFETEPEVRYTQARKDFTRTDIRQRRWKGLETNLDDNWNDYEFAKEIYVWEGDEGDKKTDINLGVTVKIGQGVNANLGVKVSVDNKRDDIYRSFMERGAFYELNRLDGGNGVREGYQVRHSGNLYWYFRDNGVNSN
jgi:hypothetical protein